MKIKILYFAQLADLAQKSEETLHLDDPSPAQLYGRLQASISSRITSTSYRSRSTTAVRSRERTQRRR